MLFAQRKDILLPQTAPSGTGAQTIRFLVKQERRRLEGFTFKLALTTNGSALTGAAWAGLAGVVKEIRLVVNDGPAGGGQRNLIQISGPACLSYIRQLGLSLDRETQRAYAAGGFPTSTTVQISFYVPIRHPSLQEPFRQVLSYPLSSTYSANDAYVEVDLNDIAAGGTVITTNAPAYASTQPALVQVHLAEVPDSYPYIRSEWRTDTGFSTNATANVPYEFTSGGFVTGFLIQGYSAAITNSTTRSTLLSSGGQLRIEYGREVLLKTDENFQQAYNDMSTTTLYPQGESTTAAAAISSAASPALQNRQFTGESFFDFLTDLPGSDAFSLASCPDLNTDALGGDKFRVVWNDLASSSRPIHITYHKLLSSRSQITSVVEGFAKRGATV